MLQSSEVDVTVTGVEDGTQLADRERENGCGEGVRKRSYLGVTLLALETAFP